MKSVYLCNAKRTAIGSFGGAFSNVPAAELGAQVIKSILGESKLPADAVHQVILGCVLTAGQGQAPARQAVIKGGLPKNTQALTVNKVCSSGLKAVMLAANEISVGDAELILAGGMENMSLSPYIVPTLRNGARLGHAQALDTVVSDGLWDVYNNIHMGSCAELCAKQFSLTRKEQDDFALMSYKRAQIAIESGWFAAEIAPVQISQGKTVVDFAVDEEPGKLRAEKVPELRPVFEKDGTITAANASSLNDGASVMIVCSEEAMKRHGLTPLARIVATGWNAHEPEWFTTAPIGALNNAVSRSGLSIEKIDLFEVNEAFSAVALACQRELRIPGEKLNISGGAVALGHPIGASGARILTTLLHNLKRLSLQRGAVAICNGGGEATAMVVERV